MAVQEPLWDENEERMVRYLLGASSPEEEAQIDERLFVEGGFHEELLATGDDLIRAYLVGRLPAEDRARFEQHFLASPRGRERFEFLRDVIATVGGPSAEATSGSARRHLWAAPWMPWLAAAAL